MTKKSSDEISAKGIILSAFPQGEQARRLSILTDKLGRISAFSSGGAKQSSHLIGKLRPFTAASFTLSRGKSAYTIREVKLIRAFDELSLDALRFLYASFVLETAMYFSGEGMDERDCVSLLNLMYLCFERLSEEKEGEFLLIKAIYELRLLKIDGSYEEKPLDAACGRLYEHVLKAPLRSVFDIEGYSEAEKKAFTEEAEGLFFRQAGHVFKSGEILRSMHF